VVLDRRKVSARQLSDHAAAEPGIAWLLADRPGKFYRSDRYDIWHNVAKPQGHVNIFRIDRYEKDE
jgi:hypothetical protein